MNAPSWKQPSAFLPLVMSLVALAMVLGHAAMYGVTPEADEGAAAHIFQLLMSIQALVVVYFAVEWLPRAPRQALTMLALQIGAALIPVVAVVFLT